MRGKDAGGFRSDVVPGRGASGGVMFIGEAPGWEEQLAGEAFVGKAGLELWAAVERHTGLTREDVYTTNLVKEGLPSNRDPKPEEIAKWLPAFLEELDEVRPALLVPLGGFATRAVLGDVALAAVHGIPHETTIAGQTYPVLPCYHPAAGLHNKGFIAAFHYDIQKLGSWLEAPTGGAAAVWRPSPRPITTSWLLEPPRKPLGASGGFLGLDTEGWTDRPWGLQFSLDGDHAYVIPSTASSALRWFAGWVGDQIPVLHNAAHDLPVLEAMGVRLDRFEDTQIAAYHEMLETGSGVLEQESQNLGTLGYRVAQLVLGELSHCPGVDLASRVIPYTDAVRQYAGEDAAATRRLADAYRAYFDHPVYRIDRDQIPFIVAMVAHGLPFDETRTLDYYTHILGEVEQAAADLRAMAGADFNPKSHPQVRELVTKKYRLGIRKRTKGGQTSTNEKALADHQHHPFVARLQEYRELTKLEGTYLNPLLNELANGGHR